MKHILIFIFVFFHYTIFSQVFIEKISKSAFPKYNFQKTLIDSISKSLAYNYADVMGEVHVSFGVDTSGNICDVKVLKGISSAVDKEFVEKILYKMPPWEPAIYKNHQVYSTIYATIIITLY